MEQQRRSGDNDKEGAGNDDDAMPLQQVIERGQFAETHRGRFPGRGKKRQYRRHKRDAAKESNQHSGSGNQAELGEAPVGGRQEREEGHGRCGRSQRKRRGHLARGPSQRLVQIVTIMPLGAVTDAELNAKVDAKSDEQDEERDGEQIEGSHKGKTKRCSRRKADHHAEGDRGDNLP